MAKFIEQITVVGVGQIGAIVAANINLGADVTGTLPVGSLSADAVTVTAGTNLTGGGTVALGSSITINCPNFVASGASHAAGAVPDPGASAGTTHFLREDATWAVPPSGSGTVTSVVAGTGLTGGTITTTGTIALAVPVSVADGGTNSTTAHGNGCVIVSSGGALVESGTLKTGGGSGLTGLGTPTGSTDAAPKSDVDGVAQGLSVTQSCQCATTTVLPTYTYLSGVITITATGTLTIDGHLTALGDRVLV